MDEIRPRLGVDIEIEPPSGLVWFCARLTVDGVRWITYGDKLDDPVLQIPVFFRSLTESGRLPLYTCTCGDFGCGGAYVDVIHTACTWGIRSSNSYEDAVLFPWDEVEAVAESIERVCGYGASLYGRPTLDVRTRLTRNPDGTVRSNRRPPDDWT